jgi:hypothetical protein
LDVPKVWWAKRFVFKLIGSEFRAGGKTTPRSGEGRCKNVKDLVAQLKSGKPISTRQANRMRTKLNQVKKMHKATVSKVEKAMITKRKIEALIEKGNFKAANLQKLMTGIESSLRAAKKPADEETQARVRAWHACHS